jgi:hypothetical protein
MSLTTTARNQALDAITIDSVSLHSAFPGAVGSNELSGSGYARQSATFGAATGGVRSMTALATFTVGAGHTVRWVGLWGAGVFKGYAPNGGSPKEFQVNTTTDTISCPAHGFSDGDAIAFYGGTIPGGLVEGTIYYAVGSATDSFQVAATIGGAAIDITSQPAPDCVVSRVTESVYGGVDTHVINTWAVGAVF